MKTAKYVKGQRVILDGELAGTVVECWPGDRRVYYLVLVDGWNIPSVSIRENRLVGE